jgi:hypothetical protein
MDDAYLYRRPELARRYLGRLKDLPERALSLFGPRQTGKTTFLNHDMAEEAEKQGFTPIYVDFMASDDPLDALNGRLADVVHDAMRRTGQTTVTGVRGAGFGVTVAAPPPGPSSKDPGVQLQHHVAELIRQRPGTRILLMLDEAQELVRKPTGERAMRAIRALFNTWRGKVLVLITGSSRDGLLRLFGDYQRPSFGLADHEDFQLLGRDFVAHIAKQANAPRKTPLDVDVLTETFALLGHRPADFIAFVGHLTTFNIKDLVGAVKPFLAQRYPPESIRARFARFTPLQQLLMRQLAAGVEQLTSAENLQRIEKALGSAVTAGGVTRALGTLPDDVVARTGRGRYEVADPLLLAWIKEEGRED